MYSKNCTMGNLIKGATERFTEEMGRILYSHKKHGNEQNTALYELCQKSRWNILGKEGKVRRRKEEERRSRGRMEENGDFFSTLFNTA
jgi:hypothetical protein